MAQISLFDGQKKFKIDKPIRLIELFAGYGSQHLALKYLGANFESWRICEWAVKSIQAYADLHCEELQPIFENVDNAIQELKFSSISADYNKPMTLEQKKRLKKDAVKLCNQIYNTSNFLDITKANWKDLRIINTDKYCYIMTYSFPCQDLSKAGKGLGMAKGSGTRSGMLWEVERLLDECKTNSNLPQVLLMENVPDVIGSKNIDHFADWLKKLESLGYKCYWQVLNAKDYGVPQNRERCFMVSILGDYYYEFPKPIKLEKRLKDVLESDVDEKYYLSDKAIQGALNTNFNCSKLESKLPKNGVFPTICARDYKDPKCVIEQLPLDEQNGYIRKDGCVGTLTTDGSSPKHNNRIVEVYSEPKLIELTSNQSQGNRVYDPNGISCTLNANGGGLGAKTGLYAVDNLKRQLCNELIASGKVSEGDVIRHSYSNSRMQDTKISNAENHDCCPTLDTRCDCLGVVNNYRIRKLTPRECFRLMGVRDKDFDKIAKNQSNASLYHLAGDSIVVDVLMAIFKEML